jgi:hypothetical protein
MKTLFITSPDQEPLQRTEEKLLCWKSVFAGVVISVMSYMMLTSLGAGISGLIAASLINHDESGVGLATASGLWMGLCAVISLFLGSYYTLRISKFITNRVGAAHGFAVASIFFILMAYGAGGTLGVLTRLILVGNHSSNGSPDAAAVATSLADAGWILFVTFSLGLLAAVLGGRLGAHANLNRPIHEYQSGKHP